MTTVTVSPAWVPSYSFTVSRDQNISYGGGTRARLIYESLFNLLNSSLSALGWFAPTVYDKPPGTKNYHPVTLLAEQLNWLDEIKVNTAGFVPENVTDSPWELGSQLAENRWVYYLDFLGENEAISLQFAGDVMDILRGKLSAIGRGAGPALDICDWSQVGAHYKISWVYIDHVSITRLPVTTQRWMRYMRTVRFEVEDYYDVDTDDIGVGRGHWGFLP